MPARPYLLLEANYRQLLDQPPNVAVLPWGATEAHNYHMPYGTDVIEASHLALSAAEQATERGARVVVLPTIPFGNDEQQLDQVATISIRTVTSLALLTDVARSLTKQGIDRLVIINGHGGNQFKPLVRDVQAEFDMLIVVMNFWELCSPAMDEIFDDPGDHAGELETSLVMHFQPELVDMPQASDGARNEFELQALRQPGVWTPRPWAKVHPDTGSGNPEAATPEKGARYAAELSRAMADVLVDLSAADKGQLPYV